MVSTPFTAILGKVSAILATCELPDFLDGFVTALQRHTLNGNPTLVLRSGDSEVFHVYMEESRDVRESVVCIAVRFL